MVLPLSIGLLFDNMDCMTGDVEASTLAGFDTTSEALMRLSEIPSMLVSVDATARVGVDPGCRSGGDETAMSASTALATLALPAPAGDDAAWALSVIEAVEVLKSRLDLAALQAWRLLHAAYTRASVGLIDPASANSTARERDRAETTAASGTVDEVMAATGLSEAECRRRLSFALAEPARVETLTGLLEAGELSLIQACWLHEDTAELEPADADAALAAATRAARDGTRPSRALVRRRLQRELARRTDPASHQRPGRCRHDAGGRMSPDGTGSFWITGDQARVTAADARVDRLARGIKASGAFPERTLAQLRSDVALDLLLRGDPGAAGGGSPEGAAGLGSTGFGCAPDSTVNPDVDLSDAPAIDWSLVGELPPARVRVVVPLPVLLGEPGLAELPGYGWIDGVRARELAFAPGSVWERLVTDPTTGALIELSPTRYVPSSGLRDHVVARDGVCRFPGCTVVASVCDLDHDQPWPHGPTTAVNLSAKHRRHHQLKTAGLWRCEHADDDALTWTSLAGRRYVTEPRDYRDLDPPPDPSPDRPTTG